MSTLKQYKSVMIGLICFSGLLSLASAYYASWCDPSLCPTGIQHIACENDGDFHQRCSPDSIDVDISRYKYLFVHEHNKRRNEIALGNIPGYYSATRMASMIWDDELQYLATLNLHTCLLDHDECHTTYRFRFSGQNLCAVFRDRSPFVNVSSLIEQALNLWFDEYPLIDYTYIDSFRVESHFEDYGHFAEMVVDRNNRVGCGIIRFTRPDYTHLYIYHIVCNYASVYALDTPVYEIGYPTTECKTGRHTLYSGLCSTQEPMDPNWW